MDLLHQLLFRLRALLNLAFPHGFFDIVVVQVGLSSEKRVRR